MSEEETPEVVSPSEPVATPPAATERILREAAFPDLVDESDHRLDPQSITASQIAGALTAVVFSILLFFIVVPAQFSPLNLRLKLALLLGWGVFSALLAGWSLFWPSVRYRYTSYRVEERGLTIRRGVFWRSVISVPRSRVQHTDVSQGPVERGFDLATLTVHTAGTLNSQVNLSGLSHSVALRIRDFLLAHHENDSV